MKAHPKLKIYTAGQSSALRHYGFEIWDIICSENKFYHRFKLGEAAAVVKLSLGMSGKTASLYTSAVLHNVLLDQDHGNPCLEKLPGAWRLLPVEYR